MKKILAAWIEQFIEFDSEMEFAVFEQKLRIAGKVTVSFMLRNVQMENIKSILCDSITTITSRKVVKHNDIQ